MHAEFGLDLLDFFRGLLPWGKLDRLIGRLMEMPRSQFQLDLAEDDEAAEEYLAAHGDTDSGSSRPSLAVWSPEVEYLAAVVDRLGEVVQAVISTVPKAKPPRIKPVPRPKSAFDRARERRAWRRHGDLVAEVEAAQARWVAANG